MARPKLSHPGQPRTIRAVLRVYEFFASLKLAVILILSVAVVLAVATFVESYYNGAAVGFLIYHTAWFASLLTLLAANIFCAAAIRFPWKRHQTGFVVTHIGLLTLLAGSAITARGSLNSQMLVYLNDSGHVAIDRDQAVLTAEGLPGRVEPLHVRFSPGPFNWADLAPYPFTRRVKTWFGLDNAVQTWQHPSQVLYEHDDAKLEVVDYYSRSEFHRVPHVGLTFFQPMLGAEFPMHLEFDAGLNRAHARMPRNGPPAEIVAWRAKDKSDLRAFKECIPGQTVEGKGTAVLWADGEVHSLGIDSLEKQKSTGKPYALNDHLSVELVAFAQRADIHRLASGGGLSTMDDSQGRGLGPAVELLVRETSAGKETPHQVIRFAELPFVPNKSQPSGFRAEYYHPDMPGRIDILIGPDDLFAYRAWQQKPKRVVAKGDVAIGETVDTWSMGGGRNVMKMTLNAYDKDGENGRNFVVKKLPFDKEDPAPQQRVKLRLSWKPPGSSDWRSDEFWLKQNLPPPWESEQQAQVYETDVGRDKPVRVSYNIKETDVGFAFLLFDFDLEVDPGTKIAANYTSRLVQIDVRDEPPIRELRERLDKASGAEEKQRLREELTTASRKLIDEYVAKLKTLSPEKRKELIDSSRGALDTHVVTMNEPLDYPDLLGRQLRFFQENYVKPDAAGAPLGSVFRVNYDPGRPVKYLGSGLIVLGIFLMFYMRAYFFKKPAQGATP